MNKTELIFASTNKENYLHNFCKNQYVFRDNIDQYLLSIEDDDIKNDANILKKEFESINTTNIEDTDLNILNGNYYQNGINKKFKNNILTWSKPYDGKDTIEFKIEKICDTLDQIYLHIDFGREITNDDIYNLLNISVKLIIGDNTIFSYRVLNSIIIESLKCTNIFPEIGILRLCILDFKHSLPLVALEYHNVYINFSGIVSSFRNTKSFEFKISGKWLDDDARRYLAQTSTEHLVWQNKCQLYQMNGNEFDLNHGTRLCQFMLFYYKIDDHDFDSGISSIGLMANNSEYLYFDQDELITINIYNYKMYIICLDPKHKQQNKFIECFTKQNNGNNICGVDLSKLNNLKCKIEFESDYKTGMNVYIDFITLTTLCIMGGMCGIRYT
jgi:hypothetical protein